MNPESRKLFNEETEHKADVTPEIIFTPMFSLNFSNNSAKNEWQESLFAMGAKRSKHQSAVVLFWKRFSSTFLQHLSRLPDNISPIEMKPPQLSELEEFVGSAPPMAGGEYISAYALESVWRELATWVKKNLKGRNIADFLHKNAPAWRRVGRLTFHLAENKANEEFPFAFMVTYVPSLTVEGLERHAPIIKAIQFYAGKNDKESLVRLLSPVRAASEKLRWVAELNKEKKLYNPQLWGVNQAYRFLLDVPILEQCGLTVRIPDWWRKRPKAKIMILIGENETPMGYNAILDWEVGLAIGDHVLSKQEKTEFLNLARTEGLVIYKGQWIEASKEKLENALRNWEDAKAEAMNTGISFLKAMRLVSEVPADDLKKEGLPLPDLDSSVKIEAGAALKELLHSLKNLEESSQPPELTATLRPYQKVGLSWLLRLTALGLGGCLADDMGLGKTIQILALLLKDKTRRKKLDPTSRHLPSLLVAPASLLANWRLEAQRFSPTLRVTIYHPSETPRDKLQFWENNPEKLTENSDLIVTSYSMMARSFEFFKSIHFRLVILDEAQAIKNPFTKQSRAVRGLDSVSRLALTGTPIENNLIDLWSLYDFLIPGLLGSYKRFKKTIDLLDRSDSDGYAPLRRLISPYLLRRLKSDKTIISDLPDKVETSLYCQLTKEQAILYQRVVDNLSENLDKPVYDENMRRGLILNAIMRLKQVINHPSQLTGDLDWNEEKSGKFLRLRELLSELSERQERILIFTQYREIIEPLSTYVAKIFGRPGLSLHGGTPVKMRQNLVEEFQKPDGPPFFILSLKAAGTGLNLTQAGHVIHFDRWWNPAVEDQATDRAYRIGQKKNVLVHKCVTLGTMEERINDLLTDKRNLADEILRSSDEINILSMDDRAILKLVSLDIDKALLQ